MIALAVKTGFASRLDTITPQLAGGQVFHAFTDADFSYVDGKIAVVYRRLPGGGRLDGDTTQPVFQWRYQVIVAGVAMLAVESVADAVVDLFDATTFACTGARVMESLLDYDAGDAFDAVTNTHERTLQFLVTATLS